MEQKNENEFLMLKNYSNFLVDLGLNISFSQENDLKIKQSKIEKNLKSIEDLDNYVKEWQIKNNFQMILRNYNMSSKIFLLLSERNPSIRAFSEYLTTDEYSLIDGFNQIELFLYTGSELSEYPKDSG